MNSGDVIYIVFFFVITNIHIAMQAEVIFKRIKSLENRK